MNALERCSRYAFGPNRLHYCGPNASEQLYAHLDAGAADLGLREILVQFETLYPYLQLIARANKIADPFDARVVEAYWLGNAFLSTVTRAQLYWFLKDELKIAKKINVHGFALIKDRIRFGMLPFHAFHVFNIWRRTGNKDITHTLESMDQCRVGWGRVSQVDGPRITVSAQPLTMDVAGLLLLGEAEERTVTRSLEAAADIDDIAPGNTITFHWGVPCEVITPAQAEKLKKYTMQSIALANLRTQNT